MSHFLLAVLLPADTRNIRYAVDAALEPFQANTVTPELLKFFERAPDGDLIPPPDDSPTLEDYADSVEFDEIIQPLDHHYEPVRGKRWSDLFRFACDYADQQGLGEPDPLTGRNGRWENPNGKWMHWKIGGEWATSMNGKARSRVSRLPEDFLPFAILTPTGEWIEEGTMLMWGMVGDRKAETDWKQTVRSILSKYGDCIAVAVDCKI